MLQFDNQKNTLRELYNKKNTNSVEVQKKTNDDSNPTLDIPYSKITRNLIDTGNIEAVAQELYFTSIDQNQLLPVNFPYQFSADLNIASNLFPFIDWQYSFTAAIDKPLVPAFEFELDTWDSNFYRVTGDGEQIWTGVLPPTAYPAVVTQSQHSAFTTTLARIQDESVLVSHTRPAWKATVEWTEYGQTYKIVNSTLCGFYSKPYDISAAPCGTADNQSTLYGSMWWDTRCDYPAGNFENITESSMTVMGKEVKVWFTGTDEPPACVQHIQNTEGVTKTFSLTSLQSLTIYGIRMRKVGSTWQYFPYGSGSGYTGYYIVPCSGITTFTPVQENYFVYYDTDRRFLFSIGYNYQVTPYAPILNNIPVFLKSWDKIRFEVNPSGYPARRSTRLGYKNNYFQTAWASSLGASEPVYVRLSKTKDNKEKWRVQFIYAALRLVEASEDTQVPYPGYNDEYDWSEDSETYLLGSTSHSDVIRHTYKAPTDSISTRVIAAARSALYYKKTSKFTVSQS